jgi:lysophospholipase L1-like esterase
MIQFLFLIHCDSRKDRFSSLDKKALCYNIAICTEKRGFKFGILGDSWTDLLFGTNAIETIRTHLEKYHGYKLVGSTLGGQTLENTFKLGLHYKTIDEAGPEIKYMLISIGGNDLQKVPNEFVSDFQNTKQKRFETIKENLSQLIQTGNAYKLQKYGGAPLLWIIHGYDYPNPDVYAYENATSCRITLKNFGFTDEQVEVFLTQTLDEYNELLKTLTYHEASLRYIDLRGTLRNGKFSDSQYMFDCIHPNTIGFSIITQKYVKILEGYTNNER